MSTEILLGSSFLHIDLKYKNGMDQGEVGGSYCSSLYCSSSFPPCMELPSLHGRYHCQHEVINLFQTPLEGAQSTKKRGSCLAKRGCWFIQFGRENVCSASVHPSRVSYRRCFSIFRIFICSHRPQSKWQDYAQILFLVRLTDQEAREPHKSQRRGPLLCLFISHRSAQNIL